MSSAVPGPVRSSNYRGNSNTDKEATADIPETPKLKKIEGIVVTEKKPSIGSRINNAFGGQNMKTVGLVLLTTVIVPNVKDLLMDLINEGGRQAIYGEGGRGRGYNTPSQSSLIGSRVRGTSYNTMSQSQLVGTRTAGDTSIAQANDRTSYDFTRYPIATREFAMEVIAKMGHHVEEFGRVSVADLYDLLGVTGNGFTDLKNGWDATGYNQFDIRKVREGWILILPNPIGFA